MLPNKFLIEGLDRLGKDTLINNIQHKLGYHQVLHFSKPIVLEAYANLREDSDPLEGKREALLEYQRSTFRTMFSILRDATFSKIICNRAHLGECVYAPLYRGYSGDYVFDLEKQFDIHSASFGPRLILLTEDFAISKHFVDDGESFDVSKREAEQMLFLEAFEKSNVRDKRIVCVTDQGLGGFRPPRDILQEVLA